jgi:hypothetical protein
MSDAPATIYLELRNLMLDTNPFDHGFEPSARLPHLWGVMVEVGFGGGSATLVSWRTIRRLQGVGRGAHGDRPPPASDAATGQLAGMLARRQDGNVIS